jgi:hypothetical protein
VWNNSACSASGGYEKSLLRVLLQSAEAGQGSTCPLDEAQRDTVLLQGSSARARCNKGKDRTAALLSLAVGPRWDAADITADGRQNVAQGMRLRCLRT